VVIDEENEHRIHSAMTDESKSLFTQKFVGGLCRAGALSPADTFCRYKMDFVLARDRTCALHKQPTRFAIKSEANFLRLKSALKNSSSTTG